MRSNAQQILTKENSVEGIINKVYDVAKNTFTNIKNVNVAAAAAIVESKFKWDNTGGHRHSGTNSRKVLAVSVPITDAGGIITATEVEGALQEHRGLINNKSNNPHSHSDHTNRTKKHLIWEYGASSGGFNTQMGISLDPAADEYITFIGKLPEDYVSMTNMKVIYSVNADVAAANVVLDIQSYIGAVGEAYDQHTVNDLTNVIAIALNDSYKTRSFTTDALLTDADDNDIFLIKVTRDANHASDTLICDLVIRGILLTYIADQ